MRDHTETPEEARRYIPRAVLNDLLITNNKPKATRVQPKKRHGGSKAAKILRRQR